MLGPPTLVSGTGFFEYFLPLMSILGDIIEVHHHRQHPRLGSLDDSQAVAVVSDLLLRCERSLDVLRAEVDQPPPTTTTTAATAAGPPFLHRAGPHITDLLQPRDRSRDRSRQKLVAAYSTHILHVLHVLLHGKWDALSMLDDADDWITSARFNECAARAVAASQAVDQILTFDPELTFMPYVRPIEKTWR